MGKINQYNRKRFASTYVGGPPTDRSGETAVAGIQAAADPVIKNEATAQRERELVSIDQQANNAHIKFALNYQKQVKVLQDENADDPSKFPEAVIGMGQELQTAMAEEIGDERVRARFVSAANTTVKRSGPATVQWSFSKQEENAFIAWRDSLDVASQVAGQQNNVEGFAATLGSIATIAGSNPLINSKTQLKKLDTSVALAAQNYFRNIVTADPFNSEADLVAGVYRTIEFKDESGKKHMFTMSVTDEKRYIKIAQDEQFNQRERRDHQRLVTSEGRSRELFVGFTNGEVGLAEVLQYQDEIDANPESTEEEKDLVGTLAVTARTVMRKEGLPNPTKLFELHSEHIVLMEKLKKKKNRPSKYMNELLSLNNRTFQAMNSGAITVPEARTIIKQLAPRIAAAINKGSSWTNPYDRHFDAMSAKIKNYSGVSDRTRKSIQGNAFQGFISKVDAVEETRPGAKITREEYENMADEALKDATRFVFPQTAAAEGANSTATKAAGVTSIHTNPTLSKKGKPTASVQFPPGAERIINGQLQRVNAEGTNWVVIKDVE